MLAAEEKTRREKILVQFWPTYVRDEFDLTNSIQTKAAFPLMLWQSWTESGGWRLENEDDGQDIELEVL